MNVAFLCLGNWHFPSAIPGVLVDARDCWTGGFLVVLLIRLPISWFVIFGSLELWLLVGLLEVFILAGGLAYSLQFCWIV